MPTLLEELIAERLIAERETLRKTLHKTLIAERKTLRETLRETLIAERKTLRETLIAEREAKTIIRILSHRLKTPSKSLQKKINSIKNIAKLEELADFALTCISLDEFATALK